MSAPFLTSRRGFLFSSSAALLASTVGRAGEMAFADDQTGAPPRPTSEQALRQLIEGNKRFSDGKVLHPGRAPEDFKPLAAAQYPVATIVTCADSRVAPEILFDQGIGDLFVIRIAGNYIDGAGAAVKGSVEYAIAELQVPLVVILGHSQCGAVKAAIKHIHDHDALPGAINDLVNSIKPAVLESQHKSGDPLQNAIEANVRRGVERLQTLAPVVAPAVKSGSLKIVGATYDLATGDVLLLS